MTGNSWYTVARTSDKECVGRVTFSLGSSELVFDVLIQFGNYSLSIVSASVTTVFAIRIRSYGGFSYVDLRADETIEGSPSVTIQQYLNTLSLITFALAGSGKQECIVSTDSYTPVIEETYVTIDQVETITARKYFADGLAIGDRDNNYILTYGNDGVYMGNHRILTTVDGDTYVTTGSYNSTSKKIELKHGNTTVAEIDATAFIKDGMVDSVTVEDGYLVITFNTDAGKEPISIPLSGFSDDFVTLTTAQTITGTKKHKSIALLNIPMSAPLSGDMESGKSYLYVGTGAYAEEASGGGGGGGETLTILRNGTQVATYNGSVPVSANILVPTTVASLSDASDYATKTWVENKGYITSAALSGYVTIATDQTITGAKYFSNALAIPLSAPSSPTSGLSYLYAGSGSYAEEPGGGVADVYPLTITKNGSSWLYYDPGEEAVSVNLSVPTKVSDLTNDTGFITSSALNGYATQTWVEGKGYITSSALSGYVNDFEVTGSGNAVTTGSKSGSKITLTKGNTFVDLTSAQTITGAKKHANVALLNIPTSISSSDIESGKVYLYSGSGEYAEEASGGVADVYPLYLVIGGTTTTYDPASESTTVTFGSAAKKGYTTSITQGSADLPTSGAVYSAIAAAVTSALHYRGMSSTALTDGGTETAIIGGVALVPQSGDVVIYGGFEFLWEEGHWNKLGDDSSYALKTVSISAGTGLTGGGDLTAARTISLSQSTIDSLALADSALQSSDMKALTLKVGSITVASNYNALTARTYTITKANITDTIGSTTYAPYHADGYLPLSAGSTKPLTNDLYFTKTIYGADVQVGRIGSVIDGGIVTYFTNPSSGSGSGTGPGFAIINTPYERLLFWQGSTDDSLEIYHEGNLTKGVLTTLLESNNGYYVKKSGDTMTGTLYSQNIIPTSNTSYDLGSSSSKWNNIYTRALYATIAKVDGLLAIPTEAPQSSSIVSGEAYLYSSTGSYAETPGGGVADVYPLTITKNGSAWLSYNPGVQAESINLAIPTKVSDLTNDTGFITASSIPSTYAWSAITNTPTTLSGYGITDAKIETPSGTTNKKITLGSNNFTIYSWALASSKPSYAFSDLTAHPTTISGYGITDAKIANGVITLGSNSITPITSSDHKALTLKVGSTTIGSDYNALTAKTYTITAQNITDAIGSTTYAPYNANGYVPTTRKVNNKALSSDITLSLDDVADGSTRKLANYLPLAGGTMTGAIVPNSANAIDFGTSTYYWKGVYAGTLYGTLDDLTYLTNHALNIDNAAVKGVNFHYANAGTKPTGSQDGSAFTLAWSSAWVTQMYGDWRTNKFYTRVKTNGTWGDWAELATTKGTVEGLNTSTESDATFVHRAVPSVAVGDSARVTKVKGKTIVWNQLVPTNWFGTGTAATVSWTNNGDGSYTINGTANAVGQVIAFTPRKSWGDHKYYLATSDSTIAIYFNGTSANQGTYTDSRQIVTAQASDTYYPVIRFQSGVSFSNKKVYIKIIDLTLMFGKGSEPTSVAEFEALYPLPYYDYNAGELVSLTGTGIETNGFNQWDEVWESGAIDASTGNNTPAAGYYRSTNYIPVFPNTVYYFQYASRYGTLYLRFYDAEKKYLGYNYLGKASITTPQAITLTGVNYVRFCWGNSLTYNNDICINLSRSGYRNGEYEAYWNSTLPLPITTITSGGSAVFADGMKGGTSATGVTAYDELTSTKATKRLVKVKMKDLTWGTQSDNRFYAILTSYDGKIANNMVFEQACPKYTKVTSSAAYTGSPTPNNVIWSETISSQSCIRVRDTSAGGNVATFITGLGEAEVVFEINTPTEYTLDSPIPLFFKSDKLGTQTLTPENTAVVSTAPLNADFQYGSNLGDSAGAMVSYLPLHGGRVTGELDAAGSLAIPDHAPYHPEPNKHYLYVNDNGNYYQS